MIDNKMAEEKRPSSWHRESASVDSPNLRKLNKDGRRLSMVDYIQRRASMDGDSANQNGECDHEESELDFLAQKQEEALAPVTEDLMDWLAKTLDISINPGNFMEVLDTGVHLCSLAQIIHRKALEATPTSEQSAVPQGIRYRKNAKTGSWFARDNCANFLDWCRQYGVKEECLFESEGLVSHKDSRRVVLCLLELARIGAKYGLEPPSIIKLENEIEKEEQCCGKIMVPEKDIVLVPSSEQTKERPNSSGQKRPRSSSLDDSVRKVRISHNCKCPPPGYQVTRLQEGRYNIGGKIMFVRLLKGRHVMVRVGGGWDTLTHYLCRHDPCKITEFKRSHSQGDLLDGGRGDTYLHVKAKYKPK